VTISSPSYLALNDSQWETKEAAFASRSSPCRLCPRQCRARRGEEMTGFCRAGGEARVAAHNLHRGEEPPVSGTRGSGTVFFSGCTLSCVFCQNFPISQLDHGTTCCVEELASVFLTLQKRGAHNLNLVSPTPHLHPVVRALRRAAAGGLRIPVVYNCSGFEQVETVQLLEGLVDVWLPDLKYSGSARGRELAQKLSGAAGYFDAAVAAIACMHRQCGDLQLDEDEVAVRGVIVRHLIIPGEVDNSIEVLRAFRASSFRDVPLSLMSQYFPAHRAATMPGLDRTLNREEYERVKACALDLGVENGWFQDMDAPGGA
jgi:putative pyruvate formate lyase activating enzyme